MKKAESLLWQQIKNLKLKGQIFRLESKTINGIPDVYWLINGKSIWIELKANDSKNLGLSKYQINWHIKHFKNGGTSFILLKTLSQKGLKLFQIRGSRVVNLVASGENSSVVLRVLFDRMIWKR
jgi:Holliday junction resolvase